MPITDDQLDKLILQIRKLACVSFGVPTEDIYIQITPSRVTGPWYVLVSREHAMTVETKRGLAQNSNGNTLMAALSNMHDILLDAVYGKWQERYEDKLREIENSRTDVLPEDDFHINDNDRR